MKKVCLGLVAHVDAGKTTVSEALLHEAGVLSKMGRVDHHDCFLDYDATERKRGITIYMKQARFSYGDTNFVVLDTPGHSDFSHEMERTLQVLDYALFILSAQDIENGHSKQIFSLLEKYSIPTFIFVNKMDLGEKSKEEVLHYLQKEYHPFCFDINEKGEDISLANEDLMNDYIQTGEYAFEHIQNAIWNRECFPVFFGSALKEEGTKELLEGIESYTARIEYPNEFGLRVFKVTRDNQGNRLTHVKITGGMLKAKEVLENNEKVDQIRLYHGDTYTMVSKIEAGDIASLKGIQSLQIGDTIGHEPSCLTSLEGELVYQVFLKDGDIFAHLNDFKQLQEEDPNLQFEYREKDKSVFVHLMGKIQIEVLISVCKERFQMDVTFSEGSITYKETLASAVEGVGHYEPLRHYSEIHLWMEPLPRGSGRVVDSSCPLDVLPSRIQSQVLSILDEEELKGVLTNSVLTDIRITLVSGRISPVHTVGGDIREATLRAYRQGLIMGESILLEPYQEVSCICDGSLFSKVYFDLQSRGCEIKEETLEDGRISIHAVGPLRLCMNYAAEFLSYDTNGVYTSSFKEYRPAQNQEEIRKEIGYDPDKDIEHPSFSIFCTHGAGHAVDARNVYEEMHVPLRKTEEPSSSVAHKTYTVSDVELKEIMKKTYPTRPKIVQRTISKAKDTSKVHIQEMPRKKKVLIVDGYNMVHAWDGLKHIAENDLYNAREKLVAYLDNYHHIYKGTIIVVFDAYKVKDNPGSSVKVNHIHIVYTKTAQTADSYIEKVTGQLMEECDVQVATSDNAEQMIVFGKGAYRLTAKELEKLVFHTYHEKSIQKDTFTHRPLSKLREFDFEDEEE